MSTNTKKFFVFILTIIMISLIVSSGCEDANGPEKKNTIIGVWEMESITMYDTPVGDLSLTAEQFLAMSGTDATKSTLQFREDGTAAVTTIYTDGSQDVIDGSWAEEGDMLTVEGAGIDDTINFKVDAASLTLTITMPIDFDADGVAQDTQIDMVYKRVL